jgi:hypothetical protein
VTNHQLGREGGRTHYGRPDLFITFTCNPAWDDIQQLLLPGQSQVDRHDITTRVFRQAEIADGYAISISEIAIPN